MKTSQSVNEEKRLDATPRYERPTAQVYQFDVEERTMLSVTPQSGGFLFDQSAEHWGDE